MSTPETAATPSTATTASTAAPLAVAVAYTQAAGQVREQRLSLPAGATVADALAACNWPEFPAHRLDELAASGALGLWGRKTTPGHTLRDGDRVELYRPLRVDPKVARRERFASQGSRRAGLFAQRRAGAKAGY
jgi:putative ubiquitin-RnfH superfamily antitoxin RatB of RatAB toxin-antitoxin module